MKILLTSDIHYGFSGKSHSKIEKFFKKVKLEIEKSNIEVVILAGDIASHKQIHLKRCLELAVKYIKCPIFIVRGNHDFWLGSSENFTYGELEKQHKDLFEQLKIHHLDECPIVINNVIFLGWDGWYGQPNPGSIDSVKIPKYSPEGPLMEFLTKKALKDFDKCLDVDISGHRKSVIVSHFNPYVYNGPFKARDDMSANFGIFEVLKERFDYFCCGHTHAYMNEKFTSENGSELTVLNCGSDYDNPKFLTFEV